MKTKTKQIMVSGCLMLFAAATVWGGSLCRPATLHASAASNMLVDFSSEDTTPRAGNGSIVTDVDTDGDGVVDCQNGWKFTPSKTTGWGYALADFGNAIDFSNVSEATLRMYIHWGTIDPTSLPVIQFKSNSASGEAEFHWYQNFEQDTWITVEWDSDKISDLTKQSQSITGIVIATIGAGTNFYDDAYIILDSITIPEKDERVDNIPIEFSSDDATARRGSLVKNVDTDGDGNADCLTAWKIPGSAAWDWLGVDFKTPIDMADVAVISVRYYAHYTSSGTPILQWQAIQFAGGDIQFGWDQPMVQDQWTWRTFSAEEVATAATVADGKLCGFMMGTNANGGTMQSDSFILFDKVMIVKKVDVKEDTTNLLNDFTADTCTKTTDSSSFVTNVDTNNDGVVDCYSGWKFVPVQANQTWSVMSFNEAIDLTNVYKMKLRMFVRFGTPVEDLVLQFQALGDNGDIEFLWYQNFKQNEWFELTITSEQIDKIKAVRSDLKGLSIGTFHAADTKLYDDAYIIFDRLTYCENHTVTFNHGDGLDADTVIVPDGDPTKAAESKKVGYTVTWCTDEACTTTFDFSTEINADMTLYAKYTVRKLTITFRHGDDIADEKQTVDYGGKATAAESKKDGHTVTWCTDEACTTAFDFDTEIKSDMTLYAKYTEAVKEDSGASTDSSMDSSVTSNSESSISSTSGNSDNSGSDVSSDSNANSDSGAGCGANFGCGSDIGGGTALLAGLTCIFAAGFVLVRRKKEDK